MGTWKLKGCPRCGGDIFLDKDEEHRWYEQCLQCSYMREMQSIAAFHEQSSERERKPVLAGEIQRKRYPSSRGGA